jgi:hypothetical protein
MPDHPDTLTASDPPASLVAVDGFAPAPGYSLPTATASDTPPATPPADDGDDGDDLRTRLAALEAAAAAPAPLPAPPALAAGVPTAGAGIPAAPRTGGADLTLARVSGMIASANRGELDPVALRAALTTTDVAGIAPPAYVAELAGLVRVGRPTSAVIRNRPLPPAGMKVTYPRWAVTPTVSTQATEGTAIANTPASIVLEEAPVVTSAGEQELSVQSVDRTDPSAVEALLGALAESYARKVNGDTRTALLAAAGTAIGLSGLNAVDMTAALLGSLDPLGTPPGGLFLSLPWDVYAASWVTLAGGEGPSWWDGSVSIGSPTEASANTGGIVVVVDPTAAPGKVILGSRVGATLWENPAAPVQLRTVDLGILTVSVGLYGYTAHTVEYPGAFAAGDTAVVPTAAAGTRKGK